MTQYNSIQYEELFGTQYVHLLVMMMFVPTIQYNLVDINKYYQEPSLFFEMVKRLC